MDRTSRRTGGRTSRRTGRITALLTAAVAVVGLLSLGGGPASAGPRPGGVPGGSAQQAMPGAWAPQQVAEPGAVPVAISCPTTSTCLAVDRFPADGSIDVPGSGYGLEVTVNGGAKWTPVNMPPSATAVTAVACPTVARCYVTGSVLAEPLVAVSTDLGSSWTDAFFSPAVAPVSGISCPAERTCFAATGGTTGMAVTTDGGTTWSTQALAASTTLVSCADVDHCVAVPGGSAGSSVPVYATTDGGAQWVARTPIAVGGATVDIEGLACPTPTFCTAVGSQEALNEQDPLLLVTDDDGLTWTAPQVAAPAPIGGIHRSSSLWSVTCASATVCVTRGSGSSAVSDATTDGGAIWTAQYPVGLDLPVVQYDQGPVQYGVSCPSVVECFAVGDGGIARYDPVLPSDFVGMAATADGGGYWEVSSDGTVFHFGDAGFFGSMGGLALQSPIVGMAATRDGLGYWLVAADGGIFAFGDASFHGSTGGMALNQPIVGMAATTDGGGYWLVAADGGVFAFGDAAFHGSMGATRLNQPVVGMAVDGVSGGYWLVAADGGVFAFDAPFRGSTGGLVLNAPVVGMEAAPDASGYRFTAADGGVFCFDLPFSGSMGGTPIGRPVVGMAAHGSAGYWLVAADGGLFAFGGAPFFGSPV